MFEVFIFIVSGYSLMVLTWVLYLAIMNLAKVKDELYPVAKAHAYVLLAVGGTCDILFNIIFGSILFLEPPQAGKLLFTSRLKKHVNSVGWRGKIASWICTHLLNQFDPRGGHC